MKARHLFHTAPFRLVSASWLANVLADVGAFKELTCRQRRRLYALGPRISAEGQPAPPRSPRSGVVLRGTIRNQVVLTGFPP
jgi:hypothetical protein